MSLQKISADRLSSLPDDILIHILSFLPTKQSIISSILSKRWIHLWLFVPVLNFIPRIKINNQEDDYRFIQFIKTNFLEQQAPASSRSIHTFFLDIQYSSKLDYDHQIICLGYINEWVKHVVEHNNVQYLSLYIHENSYSLPISILSCKTLVVLKLRDFCVGNVSPLPFRFPSLKTLNLKRVYFRQWQDFMLLLDGCPVLEDLQLSYIFYSPLHFSLGPLDFEQFEKSSFLRRLNRADITDYASTMPMPECFIMFATFILKNARVLKTMTIGSNRERSSEVKRKLSSCPKASATCQLSIQSR